MAPPPRSPTTSSPVSPNALAPAAVEGVAAPAAAVAPAPPIGSSTARGRMIRWVAIAAILIVLGILYSRGVRF